MQMIRWLTLSDCCWTLWHSPEWFSFWLLAREQVPEEEGVAYHPNMRFPVQYNMKAVLAVRPALLRLSTLALAPVFVLRCWLLLTRENGFVREVVATAMFGGYSAGILLLSMWEPLEGLARPTGWPGRRLGYVHLQNVLFAAVVWPTLGMCVNAIAVLPNVSWYWLVLGGLGGPALLVSRHIHRFWLPALRLSGIRYILRHFAAFALDVAKYAKFQEVWLSSFIGLMLASGGLGLQTLFILLICYRVAAWTKMVNANQGPHIDLRRLLEWAKAVEACHVQSEAGNCSPAIPSSLPTPNTRKHMQIVLFCGTMIALDEMFVLLCSTLFVMWEMCCHLHTSFLIKR